jgi:C1A family cysteine protease
MHQVIVLFALVRLVGADIPVHCRPKDLSEMKDGSGDATWIMTRTKAVPLGTKLVHPTSGQVIVPDSFHNNQKYCGTGSPNSNPENVKFMANGGVKGLIDGMDTDNFKFKMTSARVLTGDAPHQHHLRATCADEACEKFHTPSEGNATHPGVQHSWTTMFDEGWELKMINGDKRTGYAALSEYTCDPTMPGAECGKLGQGEKATGELPVGYHSMCGATLVGWFDEPLPGDQGMGRGCFYATKEDDESRRTVHSVVMMDHAPFYKLSDTVAPQSDVSDHASLIEVHSVYRADDFYGKGKHQDRAVDFVERQTSNTNSLNFQLMTYQDFLAHHQEAQATNKLHSSKQHGTVKRFYSKEKLSLHDACTANNEIYSDFLSKMPRSFDWGTKFNGQWRTPVVDQGNCGSCYGVAMLQSLQARANLHVLNALDQAGIGQEHWPTTPPVSLSVDAHLACNMFDQGCQGGYPYNSAKWVALNGVPHENCAPSRNSSHGVVGQCPTSCFEESKNVLYAHDNYNYLAGAYGSTCGQAYMMKNVFDHGPAPAAIEVTGQFSHGRGIIGEEFLGRGRNIVQGFNASNAAFAETENLGVSVPREHHATRTTDGAKLLEARFAVKHPDSNPTTKECPTESHMNQLTDHTMGDTLSGMFDQLLPGTPSWYSFPNNKDHQTFFIDTDQVPKDFDPYSTMRETISGAFETKSDCVHLELSPVVDDGGEYTNHAILVTGWGEEKVHDHMAFLEDGQDARTETRPYWVIQNSWGPGYGNGGFSYVARGTNYAGIEHQGVNVQPREDVGMMAALIEQYKHLTPAGKELKYGPLTPSIKDHEIEPAKVVLQPLDGLAGGVAPLVLAQLQDQSAEHHKAQKTAFLNRRHRHRFDDLHHPSMYPSPTETSYAEIEGDSTLSAEDSMRDVETAEGKRSSVIT